MSRLVGALVRWAVPTAALRVGTSRLPTITHSWRPVSDPIPAPFVDVDGDDLRGWPGPCGGLDL